jgi:hypothetical protein
MCAKIRSRDMLAFPRSGKTGRQDGPARRHFEEALRLAIPAKTDYAPPLAFAPAGG